MGLGSTHRDESHKRCRPRASGDPRPVDSRFRGNDVAFDGAQRSISAVVRISLNREELRRSFAPLRMTGADFFTRSKRLAPSAQVARHSRIE
jgi:hypothetical protein